MLGLTQSAEKTMRKIEREMKRIERMERQANKRTVGKFYPLITYTPETSLAFGGNVLFEHRPLKGDSITSSSFGNLSAIYTLKNQFIVGFGNRAYTKSNKWFIPGRSALLYFPYTYYGIGNEDETQEDYTSFGFSTQQLFLRRIGKSKHRVGVHWRLSTAQINDLDIRGELVTGQIYGSQGGFTHQLGAAYSFDNRDHLFATSSGTFVEVKSLAPLSFVGDEFGFSAIEMDLRKFFALDEQVLALRSSSALQYGNVPFYQLVSLGDQQRMRGYVWGEYRDRFAWFNQAEWRSGFNAYGIGVAAFAELGAVGSSWEDLTGHWRASFGGGLRLKLDLESKMHLRVDAAYTTDSNFGVYIGIGEYF